MDLQKAVEFVETKGTALEKYRLKRLLGAEKHDEIPLQHLEGLQNDDGGFPYDSEKGKVSCVNDTSSKLATMVELELNASDACRKAVKYLLSIQGMNGSWSENEAIKQYDPPFWLKPSDLNTTMWLTANITNYLIQLSHRESEAVTKAARFLLRNRDAEGRFAGFLHSTWISIAVFGKLKGCESAVVEQALEIVDKNASRLDAGDLAWCLECLHTAGLTKENTVVQRLINRLVELRRANGTWLPADGSSFAVSTTLNVLKALRMHGIW